MHWVLFFKTHQSITTILLVSEGFLTSYCSLGMLNMGTFLLPLNISLQWSYVCKWQIVDWQDQQSILRQLLLQKELEQSSVSELFYLTNCLHNTKTHATFAHYLKEVLTTVTWSVKNSQVESLCYQMFITRALVLVYFNEYTIIQLNKRSVSIISVRLTAYVHIHIQTVPSPYLA